MRSLLVVRHAHARRAAPGTGDHARPLSERGEDDARRLGSFLRGEGLVPDLVLSSTAERAVATARLAAGAGGFSGRVEAVADLYGAGPGDCLDLLRRRGAGHDRVMLVGHNPTLRTLVEALGRRATAMPAGAVAVFDVEAASWEELEPDTCRLVRVRPPEEPG